MNDYKILRFIDDKNNEKVIFVYRRYNDRYWNSATPNRPGYYVNKIYYSFRGILGSSKQDQKLCVYATDEKIRFAGILEKEKK